MTRQIEKSASDAPVWYSAEAADGWASGYNSACADNERLCSVLESIAGWRNVSLAGEYEHGLRDIIRSVTDCAAAALETIKTNPRAGAEQLRRHEADEYSATTPNSGFDSRDGGHSR